MSTNEEVPSYKLFYYLFVEIIRNDIKLDVLTAIGN